jgi:hypothetical protein
VTGWSARGTAEPAMRRCRPATACRVARGRGLLVLDWNVPCGRPSCQPDAASAARRATPRAPVVLSRCGLRGACSEHPIDGGADTTRRHEPAAESRAVCAEARLVEWRLIIVPDALALGTLRPEGRIFSAAEQERRAGSRNWVTDRPGSSGRGRADTTRSPASERLQRSRPCLVCEEIGTR